MEEKKLPQEKTAEKKTADKSGKSSPVTVWDFLCLLAFALFGVLARVPLINEKSVGTVLDELTHFACFRRLFEVLFVLFGLAVLADINRLAVRCIHPRSSRARTLLELFASAANYLYIILGLILVLMALEVNVVGIATTVGILGIVVGFGAESLIADIFTGLCMIFENQFNVGDIIEIGGFRGEVIRIGVRTTALRDRGGNIKIMNNSNIKDVLNCSNRSSVGICEIQIRYDADLPAVEAVISETIDALKRRQNAEYDRAAREAEEKKKTGHTAEKPNLPPRFEEISYIGVNDLAASGVILRVIARASEKDIYSCNRMLRRELLMAFQKNNIEIPFPQVVVHRDA